MPFCGKCGSQLQESAKYCDTCGTANTIPDQSVGGGAAVITQRETLGVPQNSKGFWASLFDFSFSSFVIGKLIKILYILAVIVLATGTLGFVLWAENQPNPLPFLAIILAPLGFLVYL